MKNLKVPTEKLIEQIESQKKEIIALKSEIAKLKNHFPSPLLEEIGDIDSIMDVMALIPGNVYWRNRNGKIVWANNNLARSAGYKSASGIIGKNLKDVMPYHSVLRVNRSDDKVFKTGKGIILEEEGLDAKKNPAVYYSHKIPLIGESGEVIGLLGISIDISEQKRIEQELKVAKEKAEASSHAKSQFLAVINHEIRTPLTGIIGLSRILRQGEMNKEDELKTIEDLENCSKYLLTLVNEILDFSKLEAGKMRLNMMAFRPRALIDEVGRIVSSLAKEKNLEIRIKVDPETPSVLRSDVQFLRQILVNLLSNSLKFTDKGFIDLELNVLNKTEQVTNMNFIIRDTGCGMPQDKLDIIFEPFQQLGDTYIRPTSRSGTGLGLSIVKRFCDLLGLTINVSSIEGEGTEFRLSGQFDNWSEADDDLHIKDTAEDVIRQWTAIKKRKPRVLLVEDDLIVQRIHKKLFTDMGCHVDVASFGKEALAMFDHQEMFFVDIGLSDISGFDVIKGLRAFKPGKFLPVIALTGYTGDRDRDQCYRAGACKVLAKPVSYEQLADLLFRYLPYVEGVELPKKKIDSTSK